MSKISLEDYNNVFETLIKDLTSDKKMKALVPKTAERLEKVLRYCVPYDSDVRGYLVAKAFIELHGDSASEQQINLAYILGWCFQMLQGYMFMIDDVIDDDTTARGKPTWYFLNERNPITVNDAILVEKGAIYLVQKYFSQLSTYVKILEFFSTACYDFYLGQSMENVININEVSESYEDILSKWLYYADTVTSKGFFSGQFKLALIFADFPDTNGAWERIERIASQIGYYVTVSDGLHDSFPKNPKNSVDDSDIKNGAFKYLIVKAKEVCTSSEWNELMKYYGQSDAVSVETAKQMFKDLRLPEIGEEVLVCLKKQIDKEIDEILKDGMGIGFVLRDLLEWYVNCEEY